MANKPPVAILIGPASALVGKPFTVDGSKSYDPEGKIKSYEYDFLNGDTISGNGTPGPVTYQDGYAEEGEHTIVLTVWDGPNQKGAKGTTTHVINVIGEVIPVPPELVLTPTSDMALISPDGNPIPVSYSASATGGVPPITITYDPPSGSLFPVATTPVLVTARSSDGQVKTDSFDVTVTAAQVPETLTLDVPPLREALAPDSDGVTVNIYAIVSDGVAPISLTVEESPVPLTLSTLRPIFGGKFPLGNSTVKIRATDANGDTAVKTCLVIVTKQIIIGPTPQAHADFDYRKSLPTCYASYSLRDPVQLAKIVKGDRLSTVYDPEVDAVRLGLPNKIVADGTHTGVMKSIPNQIWMPITQAEMGQTVIIGDWRPGPLWNYEQGRLDNHKHFNVRRTSDAIWFEPNTIMRANEPTRLSRVRHYGSLGPPPQTIPGPFKVFNPDGTFEQYDSDAVGPVQNNVYVAGERWVRYLIVINQRPDSDSLAEFSLWTWVQGAPDKQCILDKVFLALAVTNRPQHFDFEMNSSSQRARDASPQAQSLVPYIWAYGRDVTVHRGEADPVSLLKEPVS